MQWLTLAFVSMALCAVSMARTIPNGMVFYQTAPMYYKRSAPLPQRMMYVQYLPQHASRRSASSGGVSAFAAGDTIATGTYMRECNHETEEDYATPNRGAVEYESSVAHDPIKFSNEGATSIAEAYPEQNLIAPDQIDAEEPDFQTDPLRVSIQSNDPAEFIPVTPQSPEAAEFPETPQPPQSTFSLPEATEANPDVVIEIKKEKKPKGLTPQREYYPGQYPTISVESATETPASNDVELPAEVTVDAPVDTPARIPARKSPAKAYIPPRKKVRVELEAPESVEYEDEPVYYVPQYNKKTKGVSAPKPQQLPAGTFFPIDFGGASGGAIAIANSFSTGEGGSATSTATAYGSPAEARSKAAKKRIAAHRH